MKTFHLNAAPMSYARVAGLLYLVIIVCGIGGEGFIRAPLINISDAAGTAANLMAAPGVFRASILADVVMALSDVALAVLLFVLLRPVSYVLSLMAMAFRLVQAAILGFNLLNLHTAMALLDDSALVTGQRDALVTSFLGAHGAGYDIGLFFFGVNCLLVSILLIRSGYFPRFLGWLILAAGVVYLVGSMVRIVSPALVNVVAPAYVVPLVAELAFCLWLAIKGLDASGWRTASQSAH